MKLRINNLILNLILVLSCVFAVSLTEYEYYTSINVDCDEYLGNVEFVVPRNFEEGMSVYFDGGNIFCNKQMSTYFKTQNWYLERVGDESIEKSEKVFDGNYGTYLIVDNESLNGEIRLKFNNPNLKKVDRIVIDLKDSSLDSLRLYNSFGEEINFDLVKNVFSYELILDESLNVNNLELVLIYNNYLKIREFSFYEFREFSDGSKFSFYLNNECGKTFNLYYGVYGDNYLKSYNGKVNVPVSFPLVVSSSKNQLYVEDLDADGILNDVDNCLKIKNVDQKDINYNNIGDACEDFDRDGVMNNVDNCIDNSNYNQIDDDGDE